MPKIAKKAAKRAELKKAPLKAPPFLSTGFWLFKSEPESYSIDAFAKDGKTLWTGVRNYQARNFMIDSMKAGDQVLFYHSNAEPPAIVGVGEVVRVNLPDPSALDPENESYDAKSSKDHPIWFCAELKFKSKFKRALTLPELKAKKELLEMRLFAKGQRLSILPVEKKEFSFVERMAHA